MVSFGLFWVVFYVIYMH